MPRNRRFVPLPASEWTNDTTPNTTTQASKIIKKPVASQARPSPSVEVLSRTPQNKWSVFLVTQHNIQELRKLCHNEQKLAQAGYVREKLSEDELRSKLRCLRCSGRNKCHPPWPAKVEDKAAKKPHLVGEGDEEAVQDVEGVEVPQRDGAGRRRKVETPKPVCFYHSGVVFEKFWQCCGKHCMKSGCIGEMSHDFGDDDDLDHQQYWAYYNTPKMSSMDGADLAVFGMSQYAYPAQRQGRLAIAIDCEMGTAANGDTELLRLTAIDIFTNEKLVDNIVKPEVDMLHLNTKYSGVSWKDINNAVYQGTCFFSKDAAREALLKYVDGNTIILAHSGSNDFNALRWIHPSIIDTFLLYDDRKKHEEHARQLAEDMREAESLNITVEEVQDRKKTKSLAEKLVRAAGSAMVEEMTGVPQPKPAPSARKKRAPGGLSLKSLVKEHAGIDIQTGFGHDSLEDALACRELAIRYIRSQPESARKLSLINDQIAHSFLGKDSELYSVKQVSEQANATEQIERAASEDAELLEFANERFRDMLSDGDDHDVVLQMLGSLMLTVHARRHIALC